jgi:hypothetical protein
MKDKFYACDTSYGTISVTWKGFSIINPDGSYNEDLHIYQLKYGTNLGANAYREMPFWIDHIDSVVCSPFMYDEAKKKYDLDKWNEQYFVNLRAIAKNVNKYRGLFIFDLYDHCGTKDKGDRVKLNPWLTNIQGVDGWWDSEIYCSKWERKVNNALLGLKWIPTIGNELEKHHIEQGKRTLLHMLDLGHKIVYHGMMHNTKRGTPWWHWHQWQKKEAFHLDDNVGEVWHLNGSIKKIREISEDSKNIPLTPPIFFSTDGIGEADWPNDKIYKYFCEPFLKVKKESKFRRLLESDKPMVLECLNYNNPDACLVWNRFHKDVTGRYLNNFGKYEGDLKPPPVIKEPEKEKETENKKEEPKEESKMKFDWKIFFQNIWKFVLKPMKIQPVWILVWILLGFILGVKSGC